MQTKESTNFLLIGFYILTVIFRTSALSQSFQHKEHRNRITGGLWLKLICQFPVKKKKKHTKETNCFNRFVIKSREQMKLTVQMCSTDSCLYDLCIVRDSIHMRAEENLPPLF